MYKWGVGCACPKLVVCHVFFPVIKSCGVLDQFWFMTGLPQKKTDKYVLQIHHHSEQNIKVEINHKVTIFYEVTPNEKNEKMKMIKIITHM